MKEIKTKNYRIILEEDRLKIYTKQTDAFGTEYYQSETTCTYSVDYFGRVMREMADVIESGH